MVSTLRVVVVLVVEGTALVAATRLLAVSLLCLSASGPADVLVTARFDAVDNNNLGLAAADEWLMVARAFGAVVDGALDKVVLGFDRGALNNTNS